MAHIHSWAVLCTLFLVSAGGSASAATVCVNASPKPGCYTKIADGIAAAHPGETVQVAQGTYHEKVIINKSLSLVGFGASNTILGNVRGVG
jgi:nitrous oxidase accessory protein NosD